MSLIDSLPEGLRSVAANPVYLAVIGIVAFIFLFVIVFVVALLAGKRKASSEARRSRSEKDVVLDPKDFPDADFSREGAGTGANENPAGSAPSSAAPAYAAGSAGSAGYSQAPRSRPQRFVDDGEPVYMSNRKDPGSEPQTGYAAPAQPASPAYGAPAHSAPYGAPAYSDPSYGAPSYSEPPASAPSYQGSQSPVYSGSQSPAYSGSSAPSSYGRDSLSGAAVMAGAAAGAAAASGNSDESAGQADDGRNSAYRQMPPGDDPFMRPSPAQAGAADEGVEILGERHDTFRRAERPSRRSSGAEMFFIDRNAKQKPAAEENKPDFSSGQSGGLYIKPSEPADDPFADACPENPAGYGSSAEAPSGENRMAFGAAAPADAGFSTSPASGSVPEAGEASEEYGSRYEDSIPAAAAPEQEKDDQLQYASVYEQPPASAPPQPQNVPDGAVPITVAEDPEIEDDSTESGCGETIVADVDAEKRPCENTEIGVEMWNENRPEAPASSHSSKYAFYDSVIREENEKKAARDPFTSAGEKFDALAEEIRQSEEAENDDGTGDASSAGRPVFGEPEDDADTDYY